MITFTSGGGQTVQCATDTANLIVFAQDKKAAKDGIAIFSTPDEQPETGTISWPGEYDIEGIAIRGIGHEEGKYVSYAIEIDGIRCGFLSSPLHDWADHELELLGSIDILFLPSDDPKLTQKLLDEIDPRAVVPLPTGGDDKYAEALKICGAADKEAVSEWKLKRASELPSEGRNVVVLK